MVLHVSCVDRPSKCFRKNDVAGLIGQALTTANASVRILKRVAYDWNTAVHDSIKATNVMAVATFFVTGSPCGSTAIAPDTDQTRQPGRRTVMGFMEEFFM